MSSGQPISKILVVEDDAPIRELLMLQLRNAGYDVNAAADAVEAAHVIVRDPPDLLLVDVFMPYVDGYEFVFALKGDPATRHIPVVFVTSDDDVDQRALDLGATAYLKKPVKADRLLEVVRLFTQA